MLATAPGHDETAFGAILRFACVDRTAGVAPPPGLADNTPMNPPSAAPDPDPAECDLPELLQALGFAHWLPVLTVLVQRYQGWLSDARFDVGLEPDFWPVADIIRVLVKFPQQRRGDDQALAHALADCDFLARMACDERTGDVWNALVESYLAFKHAHASSQAPEPYWGRSAPWPRAVFTAWLLAGLTGPD